MGGGANDIFATGGKGRGVNSQKFYRIVKKKKKAKGREWGGT